ncbi:PucR family transcriptional regulator [Evansella cellulosilytica]|uniref:Transcriptional regulator, PucR family n=1 Tax=Evansella cellulosilytica (strain ATCC 21833 / DSM 2522 / FERM P-1141 / JCM 9156 / N-4) TaxID=649639 RepID=E6U1B6_EVAC2|nr:PucR family transcriptional regulator [Evansella cellulosilytica]ADU29163.1 transcriptional regulator, PucR family [Evansella cellulosilytica DSM 2522]
MRLESVLKLPTFKGAVVVAGMKGLSRTVQSMNMIDQTDIIHYLSPEQFLLTTDYPFKDTPKELFSLVKVMTEKGAAGLGIKTNRFLKNIPPEVITLANERNFPIIKLCVDFSLGEMLHEGLGCILKEKTNELDYAMNIHRQFTNIVISGGGFSKIIESLTNILRVPIILLNYRLDIMANSHELNKDTFFDIYWHIHETVHQEDIDEYKVIELPKSNMNTYEKLSIYPIHSTNQQKGYIILFGSPLTNDYSSTLALEQAANVISYEFMKIHALEQHSRRIKNEFFTDLVEGTMKNEDEIFNRGSEYDLKKELHYVCITSKIDDASDFYVDAHPLQSDKEINSKRDQIYELLSSLLASQFETSIVFNKGDLFTLLIGMENFHETAEKNLLDTIHVIQMDIYETQHTALSFGVSNYTDNIKNISTSFQEAVDALRSGYRESKKRFIKTYRVKELAELFRAIPTQKLEEFYKSSLKDLAFPPEREKEDLMNTLSIYLNNNCQIAETAKSMFVHRNTVIYRIKKCEKILGIDFKGEDETLRLRIAFFVRSLMKEKNETLPFKEKF